MNIVLLLAGSSANFAEAGYPYPKNLVEIGGIPMIQRVILNYQPLYERGDKVICVVRKEEERSYHIGSIIRLLLPNAVVVVADGDTGGAACTALLAIEHISNEEPLLIGNGDQFLDVDLIQVIDDFQKRKLDGGTIVFKAVHPRWSYVKLENSSGYVTEAAEKKPISASATAGLYYYRTGLLYVTAAMSMIRKDAHLNGNFYVCPVFNEMILQDAKIGVYDILPSSYHSLMTPQLLEQYEARLT